MKREPRYLSVEPPDEEVTIDFLGGFAATVKLQRDGNKLHVYVQGEDDRCSILLDKVVEIPETDDRT